MFAELMRGPSSRARRSASSSARARTGSPASTGSSASPPSAGSRSSLDRAVPQNKGAYLQDIIDLQNAAPTSCGCGSTPSRRTTFIKQAKAQQFSPQFMVFPFNLTTQTLADDALDAADHRHRDVELVQPGRLLRPVRRLRRRHTAVRAAVRAVPARGRPRRRWRRPLFLNWSAQKAMHQLLLQCGPDCTRNRFVGLLHQFSQRLSSSSCTSTSAAGARQRPPRRVEVMVLEAIPPRAAR